MVMEQAAGYRKRAKDLSTCTKKEEEKASGQRVVGTLYAFKTIGVLQEDAVFVDVIIVMGVPFVLSLLFTCITYTIRVLRYLWRTQQMCTRMDKNGNNQYSSTRLSSSSNEKVNKFLNALCNALKIQMDFYAAIVAAIDLAIDFAIDVAADIIIAMCGPALALSLFFSWIISTICSARPSRLLRMPTDPNNNNKPDPTRISSSSSGSSNWLSQLRYESDKQKADKNIFSAANGQDRQANDNGIALGVTTQEHRSGGKVAKVIILAKVRGDGKKLREVSKAFQADRDVVLAACRQNGRALEYASFKFRADKEVVLVACRQIGIALQYASDELKDDKEVVLAACWQKGKALRHASADLQNDREVVLAACQEDGRALFYANAKLRADKEIVMTAAASYPDALKLANGGLTQERDCLIAAQVWDISYESTKSHAGPKIILSTRFSLKPSSESQATMFTALLKKDWYIQTENFLVYSPNAFAKGTCDPEWTSRSWPCRGTFDTCKKVDALRMGNPKPESCWRYSFRCQLEKARQTKGCMIQFVERENCSSKHQSLGNGQEIESEMAKDVGIKVFRVHAPATHSRDKTLAVSHIEAVTSKLREWYGYDCTDMSDCVVMFGLGD